MGVKVVFQPAFDVMYIFCFRCHKRFIILVISFEIKPSIQFCFEKLFLSIKSSQTAALLVKYSKPSTHLLSDSSRKIDNSLATILDALFNIYSLLYLICKLNIIFNSLYNVVKVKVDNDQEMAQSERNSHSKNRGGKQLNYYLY